MAVPPNCSFVAMSLHVADLPSSAGGDQSSGAPSCRTGSMCGGSPCLTPV